jgi:hypothetical protein
MKGMLLAVLVILATLTGAAYFLPGLPGGAGIAAAPHASPGAHPAAVSAAAPAASPVVSAHVVGATPKPLSGFPRTVLVETFTAVWCPHCPSESAALYQIDGNTSRSNLAIAELHSCYYPTGTGPCYETYQPPDGTTAQRATFYGICGYPDVYFDGLHHDCGGLYLNANASVVDEKINEYRDAIANASRYPGNVSISENASIVSGHVDVSEAILSDLNGSYNAVTYIDEYIGKTSVDPYSAGPHDLGWVVRQTMHNHPVSLTTGGTTDLSFSVPLNASWNAHNLSIVSFVQSNVSKIIENANFAYVGSVNTAVAPSATTVFSGGETTVQVQVTNDSSGAVVPGASVSLNSSGIGSFSPASGVTDANGTFSATYTAPQVSQEETVQVTAKVSGTGDIVGTGFTTLTISPVIAPAAPTAVGLTPVDGAANLNWTAPPSGGGGITYYVYRAPSASGPFAPIGTTGFTSYSDTGLSAEQTYWYTVSAADAAGFSANTTAIAANPVVAGAQGIPNTVGWWLTIGSTELRAPMNATLSLHLAAGPYPYQYGVASYAYLAPEPGGALSVSDGAGVQQITAVFVPNYATVHGSVVPAAATSHAQVTINGAPFPLTGGAFTASLVAGTYNITATSPGYQANTTMIILTPGNSTTVQLLLVALPSGSGGGGSSTNSGALSAAESDTLIGVGVAAVATIVLVGLLVSRRRRNGP